MDSYVNSIIYRGFTIQGKMKNFFSFLGVGFKLGQKKIRGTLVVVRAANFGWFGGRFSGLFVGRCVGWLVALFWFDDWEEDGFADAEAGESHEEAVDAHAGAGGWWHACFHCGEEVFVEDHCFVVAACCEAGLVFEAFALDDWVDEFGVSGCEFEAADVEVPFFGDAWFAAVLAGQW